MSREKNEGTRNQKGAGEWVIFRKGRESWKVKKFIHLINKYLQSTFYVVILEFKTGRKMCTDIEKIKDCEAKMLDGPPMDRDSAECGQPQEEL